MPSCSAYKCRNRTGKGVKKTFHKFPSRCPEVLKEWVKRIGRGPDWVPSHRAVLCCDHFHEKCFDRTGQTTRIRERAIPTIFTYKVSKDGKVRNDPKSVSKASEIAAQSTKKTSLEPKNSGISNDMSSYSTSRVNPTVNEMDSQNAATSKTVSFKRYKKAALMNKFIHDHTYSVNCCPQNVKRKLDIIQEQMELMTKKVKAANAMNKSLAAKEKSLIQEIKQLKAKQKVDLMRIEEISDSLHFGL